MPIGICNIFGPHCSPDWNAISALATVGATGAALFIPVWQRYRDKKDRQKALGYSLFLKMAKIHSDIFKLWEQVQDQRQLARANNSPPDVWGFFRPLASLPTPVQFTADELAILFASGDNDAFNAVLSMDELHSSDLAHMQLYAEKRASLTQLLPGGIMNGAVGSIDLTDEEAAKLAPFSVQLDMLVADIALSVERHSADTKNALLKLHRVLTDKLHMTIGLTLADDEAP